MNHTITTACLVLLCSQYAWSSQRQELSQKHEIKKKVFSFQQREILEQEVKQPKEEHSTQKIELIDTIYQ